MKKKTLFCLEKSYAELAVAVIDKEIYDEMVSKPDNFIKLEDDVVETYDEFAMVRFTTYPPRYTLLKISNGEYEIDEKMTKTRYVSWFEHKVNGKTVKRELVVCFKPMELKDERR